LTKVFAATNNDPKLVGMIKRAGIKVSENVSRYAAAGGPIMGQMDETGIRELASMGTTSAMAAMTAPAGRWLAFAGVDALTATTNDPVSSMANMGHTMIVTGEALYAAGFALEVVGVATGEAAEGASEGWASWLTGGVAGAGLGFFKGFVVTLVSKIGAMLTGLAAALIIGGASLAFYLPLVPFIMYTLAVIGVYILILESLIAAPLWAAAIAMPQGEGMLGDHGKQGFLLFAGVLFRPALLVAGFFFAWLLMAAIGPWVLGGVKVGLVAITEGSTTGIISILAMLFITGVVMITISHKVFGLITWLPNNVMRWMGQQMSDLGEGRETEAVGGKVAAVWKSKGPGAAAAPRAAPAASTKTAGKEADHV
jgi:conjugal transfer/type IV secretion protein DotA/TraY